MKSTPCYTYAVMLNVRDPSLNISPIMGLPESVILTAISIAEKTKAESDDRL